MLTRRAFLKTSVAASAIAGSTSLGALQSARLNTNDVPTLVFADENNPQATLFSGAWATGSGPMPSSTERDVTGQIAEIESFCNANPNGLVFGLTRDSDFFVLEHTAAQMGFSLHYRGVHDFRETALLHEIDAPHTVALPLAKHLQQAQEAWPQMLAGALPLIAQADGPQTRTKVAVPAVYQPEESGYLMSWMLKANNAS